MFSISDAAVSGGSTRSIPTTAREALDQGDLDALLASYNTGLRMMADDDDQGDDADDADDDQDDADDDDDDDDADDKGKSKKPTAEQKRIEELQAENKRRRLKAAKQDKELKEMQAQLQKLSGKKPGDDKKDDDKDDDKSDDSTAKVTELETKLEQKDRLTEDLLIRLEFMGLSKHTWKNPKAALKLLDLSEVTIGDDGEIEGLEDAADALAKSDPYLIKTEDDEDDEDDKDKRKNTKVGQRAGGGRNRKTGVPNKDKLVAKYPALRR